MKYTGGCYCTQIRYELDFSNGASEDEARTSICHCKNCSKWFGSNYGITTKIPKSVFHLTEGKPHVHEMDNGSGILLHREFCGECGGGLLEYGENAGDFIYITYGSFDDPAREKFPPKGEFFCEERARWMPKVPGVFHKQQIKE